MGECFIFVEQVPRDARQDPRLLLDFKLNPVEEERDGERENSISTPLTTQTGLTTKQAAVVPFYAPLP